MDRLKKFMLAVDKTNMFTSIFFFIYIGPLTYTSWMFYWSSQTMQGGGTIFGITVPGEMSFTDWAPTLYCIKFMMPLAGILLLIQGNLGFAP